MVVTLGKRKADSQLTPESVEKDAPTRFSDDAENFVCVGDVEWGGQLELTARVASFHCRGDRRSTVSQRDALWNGS